MMKIGAYELATWWNKYPMRKRVMPEIRVSGASSQTCLDDTRPSRQHTSPPLCCFGRISPGIINQAYGLPRDSNPSSWLTISSIVRQTSLSPSPNLAPPTASISSKNMMQLFLVRASWKISLTMRAPSPTQRWTSSEPITRMNVASVRFATALAVRVLPVPGGPQRSTPLGGSMPSWMNLSGWRSGNSTTSRIFSICSLQPPRSLYVTSGLSSTVIMVTVGSILGGRGSLMDILDPGMPTLSQPTRIPSSTSVGASFSSSPTTYLPRCFKWTMYLAFSCPGLMILVHLPTWRVGSCFSIIMSWGMFHWAGSARPVSLSLIPQRVVMLALKVRIPKIPNPQRLKFMGIVGIFLGVFGDRDACKVGGKDCLGFVVLIPILKHKQIVYRVALEWIIIRTALYVIIYQLFAEYC